MEYLFNLKENYNVIVYDFVYFFYVSVSENFDFFFGIVYVFMFKNNDICSVFIFVILNNIIL